MGARRLSLLDATFLQIERRETPMHVAALQVFQLPDDASADFCRSVVQKLRGPEKLGRPWNLRLAQVPLSRMAPATETAPTIDMAYHVRHTCLPAPGGERELGELISHLHSTTLDRSRPLWTCHVIEGLENGRFAIYTKVHHALVDGIKGMHLLTRGLATTPGTDNWMVPWAEVASAGRRKRAGGEAAGRSGSGGVPLTQWPRLAARSMRPLLRRPGSRDDETVRLPFEAPRSILNGPVTGARRVATQRFPLARIKTLARRADCSVNDIFLALCGAALRRHLLDNGKLPERSLIAGVPVSLRAESGDDEAGNAVGFLWSVLGTELSDPQARLAAIRRSMQASKAHLQSLPGAARSVYTMSTMAPAIGVLLSGQGARLRPSMNVVISNVPGPDRALYLDGARMEAMYPVSIPIQGLGLNITCVSYDGQLTVGFTGSRDSLPRLQRIAVYAGEALDELERVFGVTGAGEGS
ncbi:wax ester/triacylglycerol synthase family O-acyltransferase [Algiphilus sp.]|uniref:WS/DGAT/MGAT family O-acyltransferase n=1 Tax=Algiphilus sp. TaxID=1872431 RepID=UPI0025C4ABD4|nr:wax ester/triacylglycerol synthase family O-acyltransferase [Algiphilus sp.]MCK5771754.1 wax ester/triacylglycerol synthase family O-acyltransferase [Algiphilus sp.]